MSPLFFMFNNRVLKIGDFTRRCCSVSFQRFLTITETMTYSKIQPPPYYMGYQYHLLPFRRHSLDTCPIHTYTESPNQRYSPRERHVPEDYTLQMYKLFLQNKQNNLFFMLFYALGGDCSYILWSWFKKSHSKGVGKLAVVSFEKKFVPLRKVIRMLEIRRKPPKTSGRQIISLWILLAIITHLISV